MRCLLVKSLVTSTLVTQPDIVWKELYAIVIAVHSWAPSGNVRWSFTTVITGSSRHLGKGSTQAPQTMALVHLLYFCAAYHDINVCIVHVPGVCKSASRQHPCMVNAILHRRLLQCSHHGIVGKLISHDGGPFYHSAQNSVFHRSQCLLLHYNISVLIYHNMSLTKL